MQIEVVEEIFVALIDECPLFFSIKAATLKMYMHMCTHNLIVCTLDVFTPRQEIMCL